MPLAWKAIHAVKQREAIAEIRRLRGQVQYDWETTFPHESGTPAWQRHLFGDDWFSEVHSVSFGDQIGRIESSDFKFLDSLPAIRYLMLGRSDVVDDTLIRIRNRQGLVWLRLTNSSVTDAGLAHVATLPNLESLERVNSPFTDKGLEHLKHSKHLKSLILGWSPGVTDAGLAYLAGLSQLEQLHISGAGISDDGLSHLRELVSLSDLDLAGTKINGDGFASLAKLQG